MFQGTLDEFEVSDLVDLMRSAHKTGRLCLRRPSGEGAIAFFEGRVVWAESELISERLGHALIRAGTIDPERLRLALDRRADTGCRLGELLVEQGEISSEMLVGHLRQQSAEAMDDLQGWSLGEFEWRPEDPAFLAAEFGEMIGEEHTGPQRQNPRTPPPPPQNLQLNGTHAVKEDRLTMVAICTGNQFRSPLLQALVESLCPDLPIDVISAGVRAPAGASALDPALKIASGWGVDLSSHLSRSMKEVDLRDADLVVGFERTHVASAVVDANALLEKTFLLRELVALLEDGEDGALAEGCRSAAAARAAVRKAHSRRPRPFTMPLSSYEINDPLGGSRQGYEETAGQILALGARMLSALFRVDQSAFSSSSVPDRVNQVDA